jgi:hypothetical protein
MERKSVEERGGLCFVTTDLEVNGLEKKKIQKFTGLTQLYLRSLHFNRSHHPISNSGVDP